MDEMTLNDYHLARERAASFDVSNRGKIEVTGPDAAKFLHNLCTNDIVNLPPGAGCEAFFTTAQARVVVPVNIYRIRTAEHDSFWLDVGANLAEKLHHHLDRYLISEVVELVNRTIEFAQIHVAGPEARRILETILAKPLPDLQELQHTEFSVG